HGLDREAASGEGRLSCSLPALSHTKEERRSTLMADIALAFLWHQHQPYYPDDVAGETPMPWVRLHGVKDYFGMALHLLEYPEMRCTINLVPSLLLQIQGYTDRGATDRPLNVSRVSADALTEEDALYL